MCLMDKHLEQRYLFLLEVFNGEDLNWFGPHTQAGKNKPAEDKLKDILTALS